MDAHCEKCATYETSVMAGGDAAPCDDYVMTEGFKAWMVDRMRAEVLGQISSAGLDKMAIVKDQNKD